MADNKKTWKKSFRKIPKRILDKVSESQSDLLMVAGTKKLSRSDIISGHYAHIGLTIKDNGDLIMPPACQPDPAAGRFAKWNLHGRTIKRKDLPKIKKTYSWETPNFGDGSTYGYHTSYREREVYQVEEMEPRFLEIECEVLQHHVQQDGDYVLKFRLMQLVDRTMNSFERELLFYLNVLQESCGVCDVFSSDATRADFLETITLDWEIFPPGSRDELRARLTSGRHSPNPSQLSEMLDRVELFSRLKPIAYLRGTGGFGSYIGAQYSKDLVVFENVRYGNALYVLYEDWRKISQRSRLELIQGTSKNYDRFAHIDGWEDRLLDHLSREMKKRGREDPDSLFDAA